MSKRRIRSKKHREKLRKIRIWKRILGVIGVLLFCGFIIWGVNADALKVKQVDVRGNQVTDEERVKGLVAEQIEGSYLWIFPRNNVFLVPGDNISEVITTEIPRIKNVSTTRAGLYGLVIEVTEREPLGMVWCGYQYDESVSLDQNIAEEGSEDEEAGCYFLDDTGFIFAQAPQVTGSVYFQYYAPLISDRSDPVGGRFMESDKFKELTQFMNGIRNLNFHPIIYEQQPGGTTIIYLSDKDTNTPSGELRLNTNDDLIRVLTNLAGVVESGALLSSNDGNNESASVLMESNPSVSFEDLEYIDLRYDNKVYYRYK